MEADPKLHAELSGMRLSRLRSRCLDEGVGDDAVESAMDSEAPKAALVRLLVERSGTSGPRLPERGGLVAQLRGAAAEREAAYAHLLQLEAEHADGGTVGSGAAAETAVACASPLCEVLCRPAAEVDVRESHRAWQVLTALTGVEPARVGGECCKPGQCNMYTAWMAPDSVFAACPSRTYPSPTSHSAFNTALNFGTFANKAAASAAVRSSTSAILRPL